MELESYSWSTCRKLSRLVDCRVGVVNKLDDDDEFRWQCDRFAVAKFSKTGGWDKVPEESTLIFEETELYLGWVDPWVGWGQDFSVFGGLSWVGSTVPKVVKFWKDYVNAFKARLDTIRLHQAVRFVSCIVLGRVGSEFFHL